MKQVRLSVVLCLLAVTAAVAVATDIPARPEQLTYPPLTYVVPDGQAMRVQLANGIPAYVAADRLLPLVTVQVFFRGGKYLEPAGKEGLAELTGTVWRTGGAGDLDAAALDEELDFLAAQLSTSVGETRGSVTLNLLAKDLDRGLQLLMAVLQSPRFEQARLDKAKEDMLAEMKRRNDDAADIEQREWNRLLYGDDYFVNRLATKASVDAITRDDLVAFHKQLARPANFVVAVAGDFDRKAMIAKLNATLGAWKGGGPAVPAVPQPTHVPTPGVYLVNKSDVNQGRVSIGHLAVKRPFADEFPMMVANDIYGGGGFTAWLMSKVRSDEGLTYGAYSNFRIGTSYPGTFRAYLQTKSATCARAIKLTIELLEKLRRGEISDNDMVTSKNSFIETLPRTFETKVRTVARFAQDELDGLPKDYWQTYRDKVRGVEKPAVAAAAQKYLKPDALVILVVGNIEEIAKGHPDFPDVKLENFGTLHRLPLRDPLTLQPLGD